MVTHILVAVTTKLSYFTMQQYVIHFQNDYVILKAIMHTYVAHMKWMI